MAPYKTPNNQGFTAEFIQLLNRHTPYSFELELVTRKHLDKFLADGEQQKMQKHTISLILM